MDSIELSFPFDSVLDENGQDDRLYYSQDFATYFANFISNGVYPNPSNNLKIESINGLVVKAKAGSGFINGYGYVLNEDLEITLNTANANYTRKDIIVLRLDLVNRYIRIYVKEGNPSSNSQIPTITRNDDIYELKLAEVTIKAATQVITQADILDTRLNKSVCGIVSSVVETVDTTELFNQYETYLNQKIEEWKQTQQQQNNEFTQQMTEIENWYNSVKIDITKLQSFDFDNLAELKGATKKTDFLQNGDVDEKIFITASNTKVADRLTKFLSNGDIQVNTKVYERNGVDVMKQVTVLTKFNNDGSISEVIS
ncbi:MAG: hypothetical protein KIC92_09135 [Clostridiales bacterium]|nr:hypothetical protein [Clostridiales bacterium]